MRAPEGQEQSQNTTQRRQKSAFRQQLTNQTHAPSPDGQAHGDLLLPRRRARQQQIGNVGAGNQQNQSNHSHQDEQGLGKLLPQVVESFAGRLDVQVRNDLRLGGGIDIR